MAKLREELKGRLYDFVPRSSSQEIFFNLEQRGVFEIGFGGTPYSGKTCCMVVSSLMYAHIPEYRAAFFRREATQLEKAGLIDEAKTWYYKAFPNVEYDSVKRIFKFPSGAQISFNGCEGELDYKKYDGVEWHAIFFEELGHMSPDQITNLMSRVRNPKGKIPLRVRSSTNPGGPYEDWVIDRYRPWINRFTVSPKEIPLEAENGSLLYYTNWEGSIKLSRTKDGAEYKSISFISPKIDDLSKDQEARVHGISDPVRRAALLGTWGVKESAGMYFTRSWFKEATSTPYTTTRLRYWDLAASGSRGDFLASTLIAKVGPDYYIEDIKAYKPQVHEVESLILRQAKEDGPKITVAIEQEGGSSGKLIAHNFETKLKALGCRVLIDQKSLDRATSSKAARASIASPIAKDGHIYLVAIKNREELLNQLTLFPSKGVHDDLVDCLASSIYLLKDKMASYNFNYLNEQASRLSFTRDTLY